MKKTFWNLETNDQKKIAGPYADKGAARDARWYYPAEPKLYVVEYETDNCPMRASPFFIHGTITID